MIAKIIKGKDFYGVLAYNEKKVEQGQGRVIDANIAHGNTVDMTKEFNLVRQLRPRLAKAVCHVSLNLPHTDNLNDREFASLGHDYLKGMGFDDNQYIIYRHTDEEHHHIHIVANRVKLSGEVVDDSRDLYRSKQLVRELEKKYNLVQLPDKNMTKGAALTQKEVEKAIRTSKPPIKLILQQHLENTLENSKDVVGFIDGLKQRNIFPKFNISKGTGRVTGISFRYGEVIYKGSTLGRKYSWNNIVKHIDYEQNRDCPIILENNIAERRAERTFGEGLGRATGTPGKTTDAPGGPVQTFGQPKNHMGAAQAVASGQDMEEEILWTPFKLELDDRNRRKRKKKGKGRRL
ncbi:Relaxase/Mobilisation nuclease domain-containing protein [Flagellimonas taeanensis]|uniref:Relaxase/Mobilisation nuclease domain-containing protein n=1 Tax=Flagellimonas taeanensis TaxID=1005926 RepID=A0A1M6Y269_9FLAO|nr:relaxase/mobilization nuclease domain-containing protein [Allomuricauda taeanensis]SFC04838.1 Relaxase/Mobilisation nuclease domain-containing protein [Allomuricauda taeanensis]SHL12268.1 Relaxase/Mobilisation nuclease domain-containing protein [Allomuricauda taeanensis]